MIGLGFDSDLAWLWFWPQVVETGWCDSALALVWPGSGPELAGQAVPGSGMSCRLALVWPGTACLALSKSLSVMP